MADSYVPSRVRSRWHEWLPLWIPVILAILAGIGSVIRTETQIADLSAQENKLENMVGAVPERLARIEQNQTDSRMQLDRIEERLDDRRHIPES